MGDDTKERPRFELALDALPLFPLPRAVLFPGATMALHVFEPRYRALVRDALASHATFSVVQLAADVPAEPGGSPPIARFAGVGTIADHVELGGGRYDLLLQGHAVVELDELPFDPADKPYRRARARVVPDGGPDPSPAEVAALVSTAAAFSRVLRGKGKPLELRVPRDAPPSRIADLAAAQLVLDATDRQRVLAERDMRRRVRLVAEILAVQQAALATPRSDVN